MFKIVQIEDKLQDERVKIKDELKRIIDGGRTQTNKRECDQCKNKGVTLDKEGHLLHSGTGVIMEVVNFEIKIK